jgi:NTE family protein
MFPLLLEGRTRDILLVLLTPLAWDHTPQSTREIEQRTLELAFNATFLREMRLYADLRGRLLDTPWWRRGALEQRLAQARFHAIDPGNVLRDLGTDTKAAAGMRFFEMLFALGREHAQRWLQEHFDDLGRRSSVDLQQWFG